MLYVFACVSPQCIKRSDSVKAFRAVVHDRNPFNTFASDSDFKFVLDKTDQSLATSKFSDLYDESAALEHEGSDSG